MLNLEKHSIFRSRRYNTLPSVSLKFYFISKSKFLPKINRLINKHLYLIGVGSSINRYDSTFSLYSSFSDSKLYEKYNKKEIFCNFGSGAFFHQRWRNFDLPGQSPYYKALQGRANKDYLPVNLCEPNLKLDLENDSVTLIYLSHTIEHLEDKFANHFLKECYRILKKRGIIRIAFPSTDNDFRIASLINLQTSISLAAKKNILKTAGEHILTDSSILSEDKIQSILKSINFNPELYIERCLAAGVSASFDDSNPGRHVSFWNYEKILKVSERYGFRYCIPMYQGRSLARPFENLDVFDQTEPHISLYVELVK